MQGQLGTKGISHGGIKALLSTLIALQISLILKYACFRAFDLWKILPTLQALDLGFGSS